MDSSMYHYSHSEMRDLLKQLPEEKLHLLQMRHTHGGGWITYNIKTASLFKIHLDTVEALRALYRKMNDREERGYRIVRVSKYLANGVCVPSVLEMIESFPAKV